MDANKVGFYMLAMPSDQIATLCVLHLVRTLFGEFVNDIHKDADSKSAQTREFNVDVKSDIKIPAMTLFDELGRLFDKELK